MKYQKKDSRMALWLVILLDALLLGVILLTFAAFHHVLPRRNAVFYSLQNTFPAVQETHEYCEFRRLHRPSYKCS